MIIFVAQTSTESEEAELRLASDMAALHARVLELHHRERVLQPPGSPKPPRKGVKAISVDMIPADPDRY